MIYKRKEVKFDDFNCVANAGEGAENITFKARKKEE